MKEPLHEPTLDAVIMRLRDRAIMTDNWDWADALHCVVEIVEEMKKENNHDTR